MLNKLSFKIGNLNIKTPIVQGGMGVRVSLSRLASAVANEGGIGVISSVGIGYDEPDFVTNSKEANLRVLRQEIRKAKENSDGIIGVNIMMALTDFDDQIRVSVEEEADIVFVGAGLLLKAPGNFTIDELKKSKTKVVPIVSSARAAKLIFNTWKKKYNYVPDAVVVEGPLAGGHLGFKVEQIEDEDFKLEKLIPEVVETIKSFEADFNKEIPVIAGGGVYTGADILKFINLGAKAVQMGTRFAATVECDASDEFKNAIINCREEDVTIIKSPVGLPGRAISNEFLKDVKSGKNKPFGCPWKCLKTCNFMKAPYCIADALTNAQKGMLDKGFVFAGANAFRVDSIMTVKELIDKLKEELQAAMEAFCIAHPQAAFCI